MNSTSPTPSLEPLLYFITHSLLVMASAALIFFCLGVWFGWLTWARHKRRARAFQEETNLLRHEIATLKRRIAEEAVAPTPAMLMRDDVPARIDEASNQPDASPDQESVTESTKESLAAAVLTHAALPLAPAELPEEMNATPMQPPEVSENSSSADSADTKSFQVQADASSGSTTIISETAEASSRPAPAQAALLGLDPVTSNGGGTLVLSPPGREQHAAKTDVSHADLRKTNTGPVILPMLPALEEHPPTKVLSAESSAATLFAGELATGSARQDPDLGVLFASRPERADDLTLLRGVAEGLQKRLQECGIYTFKQIAAWTEDNVRAVGQRIQASERIQRDFWVQQARQLHYLKYGEKLE